MAERQSRHAVNVLPSGYEGSSPSVTTNTGVVKSAKALRSDRREWGFESPLPYHFARVAQSAEAAALRPAQCQFESDDAHHGELAELELHSPAKRWSSEKDAEVRILYSPPFQFQSTPDPNRFLAWSISHTVMPMRKSKSVSPGVSVSTTGKTSVASTMKPAFGRGKGRKMTRKGGR